MWQTLKHYKDLSLNRCNLWGKKERGLRGEKGLFLVIFFQYISFVNIFVAILFTISNLLFPARAHWQDWSEKADWTEDLTSIIAPSKAWQDPCFKSNLHLCLNLYSHKKSTFETKFDTFLHCGFCSNRILPNTFHSPSDSVQA